MLDFIKGISDLGNIGLGVLIFSIWYHERKDRVKENDRWSEYMGKILFISETHKKMYEDTMSWIRTYADLIKAMHERTYLFVEKLAELIETIKSNQFCPIMRPEKKDE